MRRTPFGFSTTGRRRVGRRIRGLCPVTGKEMLPKRSAKRTVKEHERKASKSKHYRRTTSPLVAYPCRDCNHWHVGHLKMRSPVGRPA